MLYFNLVISFIACIVVILCLYKNIKVEDSNNYKKVKKIIDKYNYLFYIFFVLCAFTLYFYKLGDIPNGIFVDEAGSYYDAISLNKYHVDRFLYHNPVYFINFGGGQNALYTYLAAFIFKIISPSLLSFRLPAAILGVISICIYFCMIKKYKNSFISIIGTFLMLIMPVYIMKARWGLESYLLCPLMLISIYSFMYSINNNKYYFISGLLFGITLYTYAISYLIIPLFLGISILYLIYIKKVSFKNIVKFSIPLFIFALPLILMLLINSGILPNEIVTNFISIPKLFFYRGGEVSFSNIFRNLNNFKLIKYILVYDDLAWNGSTKFGTMYYVSIPFIILGMIICYKNVKNDLINKRISIDFIMFVLFLVNFFVESLLDGPNINKTNCIYIPLIYFLTLGICSLIVNYKKISLIFIFVYLFLFGNFINFYFNSYLYSNFFVNNDFYEALDFAETVRTNELIYIDGVSQPYIYVLIHDNISPYDFNDSRFMVKVSYSSDIYDVNVHHFSYFYFTSPDESSDNFVYITKNGYYGSDDENLTKVKFDDFYVYYK